VSHWEKLEDFELLLGAGNDPEAFAAFYKRHVRGMLGFFRRRTASAEASFDLTAETFAAALEALPRYRPGPEPARAWLYGIARNKLSEALREGQVQDRARRALAMQPVVLDDEGLRRVEEAADSPALELLASLPSDQRDAIAAHHLDERDYEDVARELRCSESVVRKRVSRGLRAMRGLLKEAKGA
jgi:RNA polymerase sigma-70 factor (ECF subfamily)